MTLSLRLGLARERLVITRRVDPEELAAELQAQRYVAAYALAQLEPEAWDRCEWWSCRLAAGDALVCHSHAGLGEATTLLGPAAGVEQILTLHPGPMRTFAICEPQHLEALQRGHSLSTLRRMMRMLVTAESFRPVGGETLPLIAQHTQTINRLYSAEGGPTRYSREHIAEGCYRGVVSEGRLVAIAGTHSISPTHGISVLGNVFTHPDHRGHGHATNATSAVTAELLRTTDEVVLSVDPQNTPAVRAYLKLGYQEVGPIVEASASRRSGSISTSLRRWVARQRAEGRGEVVLQ